MSAPPATALGYQLPAAAGGAVGGPGLYCAPVLGTILTAMVTPFDADLRVDEAAAAQLAHHLVEHGSDGLVIAGTTGEASTLNDEEQAALVRLAVREVGGAARPSWPARAPTTRRTRCTSRSSAPRPARTPRWW